MISREGSASWAYGWAYGSMGLDLMTLQWRVSEWPTPERRAALEGFIARRLTVHAPCEGDG